MNQKEGGLRGNFFFSSPFKAMLLFPVYTSTTAHLGNGCRTVGGWAVIETESER